MSMTRVSFMVAMACAAGMVVGFAFGQSGKDAGAGEVSALFAEIEQAPASSTKLAPCDLTPAPTGYVDQTRLLDLEMRFLDQFKSGRFGYVEESTRRNIHLAFEKGPQRPFAGARALRSLAIVDALAEHVTCIRAGRSCELPEEIVHFEWRTRRNDLPMLSWPDIHEQWKAHLKTDAAKVSSCAVS
ncbi:hypothetical protein VQ042_21875 [Aurantimonas sp. A2-1-M11]|uniref:hypothetical protein n=1 Tax=Aurantimonas sp. A2-1-M11 TaxID=3113712 RepID=UPI002F925FF3